MADKNNFMSELQSALLVLSQNIEALSRTEGYAFDHAARKTAVLISDRAAAMMRCVEDVAVNDPTQKETPDG